MFRVKSLVRFFKNFLIANAFLLNSYNKQNRGNKEISIKEKHLYLSNIKPKWNWNYIAKRKDK